MEDMLCVDMSLISERCRSVAEYFVFSCKYLQFLLTEVSSIAHKALTDWFYLFLFADLV